MTYPVPYPFPELLNSKIDHSRVSSHQISVTTLHTSDRTGNGTLVTAKSVEDNVGGETLFLNIWI